MATIVKGESYRVAFVLKDNGTVITPEMVDGVRIALNNQIAVYPTGNLTFDSTDNTWQFPMTQKNSYMIMGDKADYQVQIKIAGEVFSSKKRNVVVDETMFRKEWDD